MKKKHIFIGSILLLLIIVILIGLYYLSVISGAIFSLMPNPPKPEITYGEFPISITYEINGEIKTIEDTIICEFDMFEDFGSGGKKRKWKSYLKSGNERLTLLKIGENSEIYCSDDLPEYYMGDLKYQTKEEYEQMRERDFNSYFMIFEERKDGNKSESSYVSVEEAWEKYKLKILSRQYAQPIQNSFK